LVIGPFGTTLSGPIRFQLLLDGDRVVRVRTDTGYAHKGLEKSLEQTPWRGALLYGGRLDPENAIFGEYLMAAAIEEISGTTPPPRAQMIRTLLMELSRISSHLGFLSRLASACEFETIIHYLLRDREKILDLFELLTGSRFSASFIRVGGVKEDVTEGFLERVMDFCELIPVRIKEYNDLFCFNEIFMDRAIGLGILSQEMSFQYGITGPNARAGGSIQDLRVQRPYAAYSEIRAGFSAGGMGRPVSDVHSRTVFRMREIEESRAVLFQIVEQLSSGDFWTGLFEKEVVYRVPPGEAFVSVESPRGVQSLYLVSDGTPCPIRAQFKPASSGALAVLPSILEGVTIENLAVIVNSLDISAAEVDR
jgi:NADH:ubiquinone oxidoreductase subunit D